MSSGRVVGYCVSAFVVPSDPPFSVRIPKSVSEALRDPKWKEAMMVEMGSLQDNNVLKFAYLPNGKNPIGCKWVFAVKYNDDGSVHCYKARLVATGCTPVTFVNEDFAYAGIPVAQMPSIRLIISLATRHNWFMHQLDVQNAYSHVGFKEEVYMTAPPGFQLQGENSGAVYRLHKTICGFKESQLAWFQKFSTVIKSMGFTRCNSDPSCFFHRGNGGLRTIILVNVDDIIITGNDNVFIENVKRDLGQVFKINYLGHLRRFSGIELIRKQRGFALCQQNYILNLLADTGMLHCEPSQCPIDNNHCLHSNIGEPLPDPSVYRSLVGRLSFITLTRPDIAFAVFVAQKFMNSPRAHHLNAVYKIIRYLKLSPRLGLFYPRESTVVLSCYAGAVYESSPNKCSSSSYCTFLSNHLISWKIQKQDEISCSSSEAEYTAISDGTCEILWLRNFLAELGFSLKNSSPIYCDDKATAVIISGSAVWGRTVNVEVNIHFMREKVESGAIKMIPLRPTELIVDILTKSLNPTTLQSRIKKLGLIDVSSCA